MRRILLSVTVVLLSACATVIRPPITLENLNVDGESLRGQQHQTVDDVIHTLSQRAVTRGEHTLDILLLSSGGDNGAFGVGFLRGWSEHAQNPMPRFDLVTGVSTGALQAPYALIGGPLALSEAKEVYLNAAADFGPIVDMLFWIRRTGGVVRTEGYRAAIAKHLNIQLRDQLKSEFAQGRQLVISTTDFDLGIGRIWNMGQELGAAQETMQRAQNIFYAATAIPGVFPPQLIDNHVHADGGVVSSLLPILDLEGYRQLAKELHELGVTETVNVRLWVVMNMWTHPAVKVGRPTDREDISDRGVKILFTLAQPQALQRLNELAAAVSTGVPGLKISLNIASIPSEFANDSSNQQVINDAWMKKMEEYGYQRGKGDRPWDESINHPFARPLH